MRSAHWLQVVYGILAVIIINVAANTFYWRFDLTSDKRYTLSEAAASTVANFEDEVVVDVLLAGGLTPEFERLRTETQLLLDEFRAENPNITVNFVDPVEGEGDPQAIMANLQAMGLTPVNVTTEKEGSMSQEMLFPWALVNHDNSTVKVPLLKNKLGSSAEERVNNSVQNLEYAFADAFTKLGMSQKKQVAVIKGNGELPDIEMADYLTTIRDYYNIGAITLDSVAGNPQKVLDQLNAYDLAIVVKPTEAFTDAEKFVMDQYMVQGGKSIWLIDPVAMELDSLFNENGAAMALPRNLNLDDLFFRYGLRLNPVLVNDLYFTQIVLATGEGNASQYNPVPWYYHPMVFSKNNHPINHNTEAVRFQFTSTLDTLDNDYDKTILYQSSPLSRTEGVPRLIGLDILENPPNRELYTEGNQFLAVLVEGRFRSAYKNRVKPIELQNTLEDGPENKMLVVADGDVIRNQLRNGRPLELGYDKWTNNYFGNKEFLVNAINYMLDDSGLIQVRGRQVAIPLLDPAKIAVHGVKWQLINIALPLVAVALFGWLYSTYRRRKYGR